MRVLGCIFAVLIWFGWHDVVRADVECATDGELINETVTISIDITDKTCVLASSLSDANTGISEADSFLTVSLIVGTERLAVILMESRVKGVFVDPFILSHEVSNYGGGVDVDTFYVALADQLPSTNTEQENGSSIAIEVAAGDRRFMLHILGLRRARGAGEARYTRIAVADGPFGALELSDLALRTDALPEEVAETSEEFDSLSDTDAPSSRDGDDIADGRSSSDGNTYWPDFLIDIEQLKPRTVASIQSEGPETETPSEEGDDVDFVTSPDRLSRTMTLGDMLKSSPSVIDPKSTFNSAAALESRSEANWRDWRPERRKDRGLPSLLFGQSIVQVPAIVSEDWLDVSGPDMFARLQSGAVTSRLAIEDGSWRPWNDTLPSIDDPMSLLGPEIDQGLAEQEIGDGEREPHTIPATRRPGNGSLFDDLISGDRIRRD
ncbi:MAG: hypothetical protein AAGD23_10610 [Pseudomonadota bacterium]